MLAYYFKISWRNLWKHKVFSAVNICGLAVGLSAFCLIALYVAHELSYDRHHRNAERVYRVITHARWNGGEFDITGTSAPVAPALKGEFPQIESFVRIDPESGGNIRTSDKTFYEDAIITADQSLFDVFSYKMLYGDMQTALTHPNSLVLTKTFAQKLFGNAASAMNRTVKFEDELIYKVTGVLADVADNSHLRFQAVRSFPAAFNEGWEELHLISYIKLTPSGDIHQIESRLPGFVNRHMKPLMDALGSKDSKLWFELQPLASIHLYSNLQAELSPNGQISTIYIFSAIGLLILLIAGINYMNLSTARASSRVKEIGVRKISGSGSGQLMWLFLTETILLMLMALGAALLILYCVMPLFNQLTNKSINLWYFGVGRTLLLLIAVSLVTGLVSGLYPALFLSGFRLIPALKAQVGNLAATTTFRQSLVTFQFFITILMITGSIVVYQQLHYVLSKDLGINKELVLNFPFESKGPAGVQALKNELGADHLIQSVTSSGSPVGRNVFNLTTYNTELRGVPDPKSKLAHYLTVDDNFLNTLQVELVAGRNYSKDIPSDKTHAIVVNEALVRDAGWQIGVGQKVRVDTTLVTVIGVVKDFHFFSLQHKIEPLIMALDEEAEGSRTMYVRVSPTDIPRALTSVAAAYQKFNRNAPFAYTFLDENFSQQYETVQRQARLLLIFTILAVSIACLGLFGLVTFMIDQRFKEIGIRKVLGATVVSIVSLVSKGFLKLIFIAAAAASPIAWWAMNTWLQDFAYRINMSWLTLLLAGLVALVIAFITIGYKSVMAAVANPVKSLRSE